MADLETESVEFAEFLKQYAKDNGFPEPDVEVIDPEAYKPTEEEKNNTNSEDLEYIPHS